MSPFWTAAVWNCDCKLFPGTKGLFRNLLCVGRQLSKALTGLYSHKTTHRATSGVEPGPPTERSWPADRRVHYLEREEHQAKAAPLHWNSSHDWAMARGSLFFAVYLISKPLRLVFQLSVGIYCEEWWKISDFVHPVIWNSEKCRHNLRLVLSTLQSRNIFKYKKKDNCGAF